jgi:hypothetical protein
MIFSAKKNPAVKRRISQPAMFDFRVSDGKPGILVEASADPEDDLKDQKTHQPHIVPSATINIYI